MKPIFIFSLPRSGSTLLQKVIMSSNEVSSVSEPWILLPLLTLMDDKCSVSKYDYNHASVAIKDFISNFPNKENDFRELLRDFVYKMYKLNSNEKLYFIDKTPRYYFIINEIYSLFPDAKFIFLVRNPLDIYSSLISSIHKNDFKYNHDTFNNFIYGTKYLAEGYRLLGEKSLLIKYENFVKNSNNEINRIYNYLELKNKIKDIDLSQNKKLKGRMGDKIGEKSFSKISVESIDKWKETFNTRYRKKILIDYLKSIDSTYWKTFNISFDKLNEELSKFSPPRRISLSDRFYYWRSKIIYKYNLNLIYTKKYEWTKKINIS